MDKQTHLLNIPISSRSRGSGHVGFWILGAALKNTTNIPIHAVLS